MILKSKHRLKPWSPDGFDRFRDHYPETEWQKPEGAFDRTCAFRDAWRDASAPPTSLAVVLTPGLFSECLPGCFRQVQKRLLSAGYRCVRTPVRTGYTIADQARRLTRQILEWLKPGERFIWCTHSKGGIDALSALHKNVDLRERCAALACVQIPVGHSWVIADIESQRAGFVDRAFRTGFRLPVVAAGIKSISPRRGPELERWLRSLEPPVPMIHVVSWSVQATSLIDSWHARLNALRPSHAHDGQFFLSDQRLGRVPIVCLPRLDHAQPVLGGLGLDVGRLWLSLASVAWRETVE